VLSVRFRLGGVDADEFLKVGKAGQIAIEVDHPRMESSARLGTPLVRVLARDLPDQPPRLARGEFSVCKSAARMRL
jgi:hypothetical protein